jgi:hypothetical protein
VCGCWQKQKNPARQARQGSKESRKCFPGLSCGTPACGQTTWSNQRGRQTNTCRPRTTESSERVLCERQVSWKGPLIQKGGREVKMDRKRPQNGFARISQKLHHAFK